jgi:hypothetical protein
MLLAGVRCLRLGDLAGHKWQYKSVVASLGLAMIHQADSPHVVFGCWWPCCWCEIHTEFHPECTCAGGPGPRLESWAFALDQEGLAVAVEGGVFIIRGCKLCQDKESGVVVGGEYGITTAMFNAGYNIATLMSKYAKVSGSSEGLGMQQQACRAWCWSV